MASSVFGGGELEVVIALGVVTFSVAKKKKYFYEFEVVITLGVVTFSVANKLL